MKTNSPQNSTMPSSNSGSGSGTDKFMSPIWRPDLFKNTTVFCTGGAGTICSVQVKALVHLGANACIIGRNEKKTEGMAVEISKVRSGARVIGIGGVDVRNFESVEKAVERCVSELGGIDYVIAGAAGNFLAPISALSSNAFKSVIDIDLIGSYNTVKATIPHLLSSATSARQSGTGTGGRIIFVSATQHYTGLPFQAHVSSAKAGVDALAVSVCLEYANQGITSNVIAPGPIEGTEGMARLVPDSVGDGSGNNSSIDQNAAQMAVPAGRWGKTSEIADATVYLFSNGGNFVNGSTLVVDGGAWRQSGSLGEVWRAKL